MLTCNIGENKVNTIDHSDSDIRKWSNKGILKCPVCGSKMIYKNGKIKIAHFAHESKCLLRYNEPETEEHMNGKMVLYKWLKSQKVTNLELELWIPETKQRPDIYFEYNGERYVIEYQCSPISSEYIDRHELYQLAGIKDIWILGTEKYDIKTDIDIEIRNIKHYMSTKTIERETIVNNPYIFYLCGNKIIQVKDFKYCGRETRFDSIIFNQPNISKCSIGDILDGGLNISYLNDVDYLKEYLNSICNKLRKRSKNRVWYNCHVYFNKFVITKDNKEVFKCEIPNISLENINKFLDEEFDRIKFENKCEKYIDKMIESGEFNILVKTEETLNHMQNNFYDIKYNATYSIDENFEIDFYLEKDDELIFKCNMKEFSLKELEKVFIREKSIIHGLNEKYKLENRKTWRVD